MGSGNLQMMQTFICSLSILNTLFAEIKLGKGNTKITLPVVTTVCISLNYKLTIEKLILLDPLQIRFISPIVS